MGMSPTGYLYPRVDFNPYINSQQALNGYLANYDEYYLPWLNLIRKLEQFYIEEPRSFTTVDGVISTIDFEKFKFDTEETSEIFSLAPELVVDRPGTCH